jgi:PAS domain S-box-containing protein
LLSGELPRPKNNESAVVHSIDRLTLRFALIVALVGAALMAFRWTTAAAQVRSLETQLAGGAEALSRSVARAVAQRASVGDGRALIEQVRIDEPRLAAVALAGPAGQLASGASPALSLPLDSVAPLRGVERTIGLPAARHYVLDRPVGDGHILRLVYDGAPLQAAWRTMILPAVGVLLLMSALIVVLFRWLLSRPLESLRELAQFAAALPASTGDRLPSADSHLREVDAVRSALNQAARELESHRRALDEQRALLRGVIDALPGGVGLKTLEGQLLLVNAYLARRLGQTPGQIEGGAMSDVGPPQWHAHMTMLDQRLLSAGPGATLSETFDASLAGDDLAHLVTKTLLDLPGREQPLILTMTTNVTELQRSQRAVEQGRRLLRAVVDADDAQIALKDRDGRFVLVNAAMQRYWNLTEAQMIGRLSTDIFEHTDGLKASLDHDRRVWAGEDSVAVEQRIDGPDGKVDFIVTRRRVTSLDGHEMLLMVARDVTRLRDLARLNVHHEGLVREILDLEDHFILVKDAQMRYVLVNAAYARACGRPESDFVGRTPAQVFGNLQDTERVLGADLRVLRDGATVVQEDLIDIGQGLRRYLAAKRPIVLADGSRGVLAVVRDVTEEREREASLRQAMERAQAAVEARSRFLANISHEIRTPINGIMGMTDLVLDSALSPQQRERLQHARDSADALLVIVNDLLDLSKIDAGAVELEHADFDLHALLVAASHVVAPRAGSKSLHFRLEIDPAVPERIHGDALRLRQVLTNLLSNAVKFTEQGGVWLRARCAAPDALHIEVEDTGPGVPAHEQERIFEPFAQADDSSTRRHGGTGLGLSISRELAALMGGRIVLQSRLGAGSRFVLELPLRASAVVAWAPESMNGRRLAWLCSEGSAPSWLAWLERWGAQVWLAQTAQQLVAAAQTPIDTIVIDGAAAPSAAFEPAVQEWRARDHLKRVLVLDSPTLAALDDDGLRVHLPSVRGLPLARATQPLTPRELHALLNPRSEAPRAAPATPPERARLQGLRVLLAEDNEVNCLVAEAVLVRHGAVVTIERDGMAALDRLREQPFDLALVDMQMPRLDGLSMVQRWRDEERRQPSPAGPLLMLAMTAHAMAGDRERFLQAGFDGYVGKPYTPHELLREIDRARVAAGASSATGT